MAAYIDYPVVFTATDDNSGRQTFLIEAESITTEWYELMRKTEVGTDHYEPNAELVAIVGLVAFFCGDESWIEWARTLMKMQTDDKLRNEYRIEIVLNCEAAATLLTKYDNPENKGTWHAKQITTYSSKQPVYLINYLISN